MSDLTRRTFLAAAPAAGIAIGSAKQAAVIVTQERPALLGGPKIRTKPFPSWPITNTVDEEAILETLRSGEWFRGSGQHVNRFEQAYKELNNPRLQAGGLLRAHRIEFDLNAPASFLNPPTSVGGYLVPFGTSMILLRLKARGFNHPRQGHLSTDVDRQDCNGHSRRVRRQCDALTRHDTAQAFARYRFQAFAMDIGRRHPNRRSQHVDAPALKRVAQLTEKV